MFETRKLKNYSTGALDIRILIYEINAGIDPFTDEDPMAIY